MSTQVKTKQSDSTIGAGVAGITPDPKSRMCIGPCAQPIPANRLAAQPNATMCVPCLVAAGDVAPIKRFDEPIADGEVHSTLFTRDRRIERQVNHFNKSHVASEADFNIVIGDDSHLGPEPNEIMDSARSLASIIVEEEMEDADLESNFKLVA